MREGPVGVSGVNYRMIFTHKSTAKMIVIIFKIPEKKRCFHFEPSEPMLVTALFQELPKLCRVIIAALNLMLIQILGLIAYWSRSLRI